MSFVTVDDNNVDAGHTNLGRVEESILYELLLYCYLETSLLLLQFGNDILHILLNLVLFFNFESVAGIWRQFGVELIFLFADEHLQMIKLCWL